MDAGATLCLTFAPPCVLTLQIGGGQTINANVLQVAVGVIKESRQLRLQPFNEYRKRFGMKPYKSFQELTGRAAVLLWELSGLCWGSADGLYPQLGYETRSCHPALVPAEQLLLPRSSPSHRGDRAGAVTHSKDSPYWGAIPLLKPSDVHLVQERKKRQQNWKSCMETSTLWSSTWACCLRNLNQMVFLEKAWLRSDLRFP